jgi:protein-L-isoaspartate(D-aspartate) O-methyltransferase
MSDHDDLREVMVDALGLSDPAVRRALREVPRHRFVPHAFQDQAYDDVPLPFAYGQTVSQPWLVGRMAELAGLGPGRRVLEVGTGSGYGAAVYAATGAEVVSLELHPALADTAAERLAPWGVTVHEADGLLGWPDDAPYDAVIAGGSVQHVPVPWLRQVAPDGVVVVPVGQPDGPQELLRMQRDERGAWRRERVCAVLCLPLTRATTTPPPPRR